MIPQTSHYFSFPCVDNLIAEFVTRGSAKELDASCIAQIRRPPFVTEEMLTAMAKSQMATNDKASAGDEQVWQGVLDVGQAKLRLVLHIVKAADGKFIGNLDSPDQGANALPIDALTLKEGTLRFEMNLINATYEGKASSDGAEIIGKWQQGSNVWPLTFKRSGANK